MLCCARFPLLRRAPFPGLLLSWIPGSIVSVSRNLTDMVVTEYGVAKLRARTVKRRVENLIAVAHPDFRAELRKEANKYMYF